MSSRIFWVLFHTPHMVLVFLLKYLGKIKLLVDGGGCVCVLVVSWWTIPPQIIQACTSEKDFKKVVFDLETTSRGNFIFKGITVCDHSRKQSAVVTIGFVLS